MAKQTFEKALDDLEKIVAEMETSDLPLDEALKKYEEGMALVQFCTKTLAETQTKIEALNQTVNNDGNFVCNE